jgi:hypothetical protein
MIGRWSFLLPALGAVMAAGAFVPQAAQAQVRQSSPSDVFYNYYVPPGPGGVGAELYIIPRPTPPLVGHTYITYPGLLPHEFLYEHKRIYWRQNDCGGSLTRTKVEWQHWPMLCPFQPSMMWGLPSIRSLPQQCYPN